MTQTRRNAGQVKAHNTTVKLFSPSNNLNNRNDLDLRRTYSIYQFT